MQTSQFRTIYKKISSGDRALKRLRGIGVECKNERTLTSGSRLDQHRWYARGNTYQFRELLKELGFRWDAGSRGWWHQDVNVMCEFMCRACRQMDQAYRAA